MTPELIVIFGCLMLSAFFSGMEIAFVSSNRVRLALQIKQPGLVSTALAKITENPSKFIATTLVGNNIALVIYGLFMGEFLIEKIYPESVGIEDLPLYIVFVQTLISAVVIMITAEFLPKVVFQIYANILLQFFRIDNTQISYIADRNPDKVKLYTPGTKIQIISEKKSRLKRPDYYLVLPWHFKNEILLREKNIRKKGTKFIFPLPKLQIL